MRHIYFLFLGIFALAKGFAEENPTHYHLSKASELAQKITNENVKNALIAELEACNDCLNQNQDNTAEVVYGLYENLDEILEDCEQEDLKCEIAARIEAATDQFEQ